MTTIVGNVGVSQVAPDATSGGLPVFQCRAWVNFDGTRDSTGAASTANTARFIRASGNVSSVVRNGVGDYTVNFTTAMPDANYATFVTGTRTEGMEAGVNPNSAATVSAIRVSTAGSGGAAADVSTCHVAIFR